MIEEGFNFLPGDLILLKGIGRISDNLVKAQKIRSISQSPRYSHVAISMGYHTFIHSAGDGVTLVPYYDIFNRNHYEDNWIVLRNKKVGKLIEEKKILDEDKIEAVCLFYLGQEYNISFGKSKKKDTSKFCSELSAKIYEVIGFPIHNKPAHKTYPYHIQKLENSKDWKDVTANYNSYYDFESNLKEENEQKERWKSIKDPELLKIVNSGNVSDVKNLDEIQRVSAEVYIMTMNEIRKFVLDTAKIEAMLFQHIRDKLGNENLLGRIKEVMRKPDSIIEYWDTNKSE